MNRIRDIGLVGTILGTTVAAGMVLDGIVDPLLIWGGTKCDQTGEIATCFGYPPAGIMVLAILSTFLWTGVLQGLSHVLEVEVLGL